MKKRSYTVGVSSLTIEFGDLTKSSADVVVSSDDSYITMGGGVSAAILRAGGQSILVDASKKVPASLGDVVITAAGLLPAKHVFHAITIGNGNLPPSDIVSKATRRSLELLDVLGLTSIAFPAIGAGVAGFEIKEVAIQMAQVIVGFMAACPRNIDITLYLYDRFRRMEPIDFLEFFEEFAARITGITVAQPGLQSSRHTKTKKTAATKKSPKQEERKEQIQELERLEGKRRELECRLAAQTGAMTGPETREIEGHLLDLREKIVDILRAVKPRPIHEAVSVFVSYSHADEELREKLGTHLAVLEWEGLISTWHDRMIGSGSEWEGAIDENLEKAHVILLLISADFVNSRYIKDVEVKRALERHAKREALVIPVILRPVLFERLPFAKIQALPRDAKPAIKWPDLDSAFVDVTTGVRDAIESLSAETA